MRFAFLIAVALVVCACNKEGDNKLPEVKKDRTEKVAPANAGTVAPDGVRTVQIEAGRDGYVPDKIAGKPGEKLKLVFTRTVEGECLRELKDPSGKLHELPMNKPYEIAVTVPNDGEVRFACGMDMFFGKIVAEKAKG
jgi:plastocyanin domain-containing protein